MNYEYTQTDLSRGILSGLFAGIIGTIANIIFSVAYRSLTSFYEFNGVDITVIVFGSLFQLVMCGLVFYFFVHYLKKGITPYRITVLIITAAILLLGLMVRRSVMGEVPYDFKFLVVGTQVIIGLLAAFYIPYVFSHDKLIS
jgi:hypothetical protein